MSLHYILLVGFGVLFGLTLWVGLAILLYQHTVSKDGQKALKEWIFHKEIDLACLAAVVGLLVLIGVKIITVREAAGLMSAPGAGWLFARSQQRQTAATTTLFNQQNQTLAWQNSKLEEIKPGGIAGAPSDFGSRPDFAPAEVSPSSPTLIRIPKNDPGAVI
jgi:hypothetical protein